MYKVKKSYQKYAAFISAGIALLFMHGLAIGTSGDLSSIATSLTTQITTLANVLIIVAYVAGIGFALGGIMLFKSHKENAQQTPLSKCIIYIVIGACLLFLPTLISSTGTTIFGDSKQSAGQYSGVIQ